VDCLAEILRECDLRCHIHVIYFDCLFYADDIMLLSASDGNLDKMLDLCYAHGSVLDIVLNAKKYFLVVVGKCCFLTVESIKIGNDDVVWHNKLKYRMCQEIDPTCFCQNYVKSPPNLIIFGTQIANLI